MSLEEDIKQKKFKSEFQKAWINIIYTSNYIQNSTARMLKGFNLTEPQYNILRILRGQAGNPISVLDIQSRMLDKMSNASRLVEKLRLKNFVLRKENEIDRRQVDVYITENGLELLLKIDNMMNLEEDKFKKLDEKEAKILNQLLDKIRL